MIDEQTGQIVTATNTQVAPNLRSLFRYLVENQFIREITEYNPDYLRIYAPTALAKLQSGDGEWERMVPPEVMEIIKTRGFFGHPASAAA
jgi:hypothetical protein